MSHIVQIETEVRDPVAVRAACERFLGILASRRDDGVEANRAIAAVGGRLLTPGGGIAVVDEFNQFAEVADSTAGRAEVLPHEASRAVQVATRKRRTLVVEDQLLRVMHPADVEHGVERPLRWNGVFPGDEFDPTRRA